jgi:hypothetical protein
MENKYFSLEPKENPRTVRIFQLAMGVICIAIAVFWIVFKIKSSESDNTLWVTIAFLVLFGIYEILAGTGKTTKYIKTGPDRIVLKQYSILPHIELLYVDIEKIELYPLSIIFYLKNRKRISMRFGLNYTEIIEPVKNEIIEFAVVNEIPLEVMKEEL